MDGIFTIGTSQAGIADLLNVYQRTGENPFVCEWVTRDDDSSENRAHPPGGEILVATQDQWVCGYCEFSMPFEASLRERLAGAEALIRLRGFHSFEGSEDCPGRLKLTRNVIDKVVGIYTELDSEPLPREEGSPCIDISAVLDRHRDPRRIEVWETIAELPRDQRDELEAIMWLGEGTMPDFVSGVAHAQTFGEEGGPEYIAGKALHKYLPRGLSLLALEGIEVGSGIKDR